MEGDSCRARRAKSGRDFYPRPPGGGRHTICSTFATLFLFLSTPSGWRATYGNPVRKCECQFLSTPSGWRATGIEGLNKNWLLISIHALRVEGDHDLSLRCRSRRISIHALRVEGDTNTSSTVSPKSRFLSTPSGWRATDCDEKFFKDIKISIHALRVEGDYN